jgi:N-acetylneuraminate synthase
MSPIIERIKQNNFVIIAECGVNYYDIAAERGISPLDAAVLMIQEASMAGAHAVKFQSYRAHSLAVKDSPAYWDTNEEPELTQFELFRKYDGFGQQEYMSLKQCCVACDIEFLSTAFDFDAVDYLDDLMGVYKISSSDITNIPFIVYQAKKGKPIILSVGASTAGEIEAAVKAIREVNEMPLVLLHCVLEYPTPYAHANLNRITSLKNRFPDLFIGYSDHTKPNDSLDVIKTAYNLGSCVIEKHFTLNKQLTGNDHYHAMDEKDLRRIVESLAFIDSIRGSYEIQPNDSEGMARLHARRSIVSARAIPKGETIGEDMLTFKRPAHGMSPALVREVIGKRAAVDIGEDVVLLPAMLV